MYGAYLGEANSLDMCDTLSSKLSPMLCQADELSCQRLCRDSRVDILLLPALHTERG